MPDLVGPRIGYYSFTGLIDSAGVTRVAAALNHAVNQGMDEVYLCFNSLGGHVGDGVYLYNHIRGLPLSVTIHNIGSVSSIAVAVFVGGERRYCSAAGRFLIHPTTIGPFQEGLPSERLNAALRAALAEDQRTEDILRQRSTMPDAVLQERRFRDVLIGPQDALQWGLVHEIREFTLPQGNQIFQI